MAEKKFVAGKVLGYDNAPSGLVSSIDIEMKTGADTTKVFRIKAINEKTIAAVKSIRKGDFAGSYGEIEKVEKFKNRAGEDKEVTVVIAASFWSPIKGKSADKQAA